MKITFPTKDAKKQHSGNVALTSIVA